MAEAFLKEYGDGRFDVESAGLEPGKLNPIAVEAMKDAGIDISQNKTKSVFDLYKQGKFYDYVITVCDESRSERCPIFPGIAQKLHCGFLDPSAFTGAHEEKLKKTKEVRDQIGIRIKNWMKSF